MRANMLSPLLDNQHQRLEGCEPFWRIVLLLRQARD
jgi:hypothetical protein